MNYQRLYEYRFRKVDQDRRVAAGGLAVVAFVSVVPILGGTSPSQLIDGWFIRPADTPDTNSQSS